MFESSLIVQVDFGPWDCCTWMSFDCVGKSGTLEM